MVVKTSVIVSCTLRLAKRSFVLRRVRLRDCHSVYRVTSRIILFVSHPSGTNKEYITRFICGNGSACLEVAHTVNGAISLLEDIALQEHTPLLPAVHLQGGDFLRAQRWEGGAKLASFKQKSTPPLKGFVSRHEPGFGN